MLFFQNISHNSLMNILQKIFTNHYEDIKYTLHPRNTEIAENLSQVEFSLIFGFPENEE